jgi:hypothetical protein
MMSAPSISALTSGTCCRAWTTAFTKKLMKPSFTPCFFSKTSLYWLRRSMTPDMSTSLKVVSMAAVFWASFSRRAMVWRRRVIFTRSSRSWIRAGRRAQAPAPGLGAGFQGGQGIALGHPAVLAGAGDRGGSSGSPPRRAGLRAPARVLRPSWLSTGCGFGSGLASALELRTWALRPCGAVGLRAGRRRALGDAAQDRAGLDGRAFCGGDLRKDAVGRGGDFQAHLVGLELHQDLVLAHRIAGLLGPLGDRRFGDGFTQRRGHDVGHWGRAP